MSNVASYELCKKIEILRDRPYTDSSIAWCWVRKNGGQPYITPRDGAFTDDMEYLCMALDLGILLRKLPDYFKLEKQFRDDNVYWTIDTVDIEAQVGGELIGNGWTDGWEIDDEYHADTPEDAAAGFVIALLEQGVSI